MRSKVASGVAETRTEIFRASEHAATRDGCQLILPCDLDCVFCDANECGGRRIVRVIGTMVIATPFPLHMSARLDGTRTASICRAIGITIIVVNFSAGHCAEQVIRSMANNRNFGAAISFAEVQKSLGTVLQK